MNCHDAENQLIASRDAPLGAADAASLEQHLQECPHCQTLSAQLEEAVATWKKRDETVPVPDVVTEWHAVRRRIRSNDTVPAKGGLPTWSQLLKLAVPMAAAFAIAINFWPEPKPVPSIMGPSVVAQHDWSDIHDHFTYVAHAEYVETEDEDVSPFVYVDEESGWLIVWASEVTDQPSI